MGTQMSTARRGIATEEMLQVAKDEDIDINFLNKKIFTLEKNQLICEDYLL